MTRYTRRLLSGAFAGAFCSVIADGARSWIAIVLLVATLHFRDTHYSLGLTATYWVDPKCVRCGRQAQAAHRSRINFDGCQWVCTECFRHR